MVGRLLWKEFREGWVVLVSAFAVPAVMSWLRSAVPFRMTNETADLFGYAGVLISTFVVMLWAIRKGALRRDEGKIPLAHIPANPWVEHAISVLLPLAIAFFVGTWAGGYVPNHAAAKHYQDAGATAAAFAAVYVPAAFASCYLIAAAVSTWAALLAAFVWALVGLDWMVSISTYRFYPDASHAMAVFLFCTVAGATAGLIVFLLLRRRWPRFGRAVPLALLAVMMFGPMAYEQFIAPDQSSYYGDIVYSADRSLVLDSSVENAIGSKHVEKTAASASVVSLTDRRTGRSVTRDFRGAVYLIGFDNAGYAYLVQQGIGSGRAGIIRWKGDTTALLATIPATKGAVLRSTDWPGYGSISPDRRYLAFRLRSGLGRGMDVWIVNLRTGVGWVAFPNGWTDLGLARWLGSRLVLPGYYGISTVDLRTGKTGTLSVPGQDGG
jgi:hypothetical protein